MAIAGTSGFTAPSPQARGRFIRVVPNSIATIARLPNLPISPRMTTQDQKVNFSWAGYSSQLFYFFNLLFYCCGSGSHNTFSVVRISRRDSPGTESAPISESTGRQRERVVWLPLRKNDVAAKLKHDGCS
jgi:hypothetical protein